MVYIVTGFLGVISLTATLQHLVHKMANRRLGVEYAVTNFDVVGTKDLPDPDSHAPSADASVNKIQEYRPDFRGDVTASNVKPYIDTVVEDVVGAWEGTMEGEELDRKRVEEAVNVYWSRLCVSSTAAISASAIATAVKVLTGRIAETIFRAAVSPRRPCPQGRASPKKAKSISTTTVGASRRFISLIPRSNLSATIT